ncbi:DNA polymerase III subunit beta [Reyranella sp.]|uniref:DNA polymerase III subunit beta n=1 Tax=Reyranella sp. TaxID=1929291 RepID=UPI003BAB8201
MKFTMERDAALRALTLATRTIERRNTVPILGHVLITAHKSRVSLAATNMDRWMTIEIGGASTLKTGTTTADAANMLAFVRATAAGTQIEVELTGEKLVMRAGRARATLLTLPAADFPAMKPEEVSTEILVAGDALARAIGQVAHAQSDEQTRYYLNGIFIHDRAGKLGLVATDGHRLGLAIVEPSKPLPENLPGIILPRQSVPELLRIATEAKQDELTLEISETRLQVAHTDVEFSTRLVDGTFPDYDRVIPRDNECRFNAGRVALAGAVARCATLASDGTSAVRMQIHKASAELSRKVEGEGEISDEIDIQVNGQPSFTGFNCSYMTAALDALACPDVDVEFTTGGPIVLRRSTDPKDGELQIVMAMRVV